MFRTTLITIAVGALALAACSDDEVTAPTTGDTTVLTTSPSTTVEPADTTVVTDETDPPVTTDPATTASTATPTSVSPTTGATVPATTSSAPAPPAAATALTIAGAAPSEATVEVDFDEITDDHVIRRGAQGLVEQGQTFSSSDTAMLSSTTFAVVPAAVLPAGTPLELTLLEVGDPDLAIPSAGIPIGDTIGLVLETPADLAAGEVVHLVFTFPEVELTGGVTYAVVLGFGDGAPAAEMYLQHTDTDVLPSGVSIWLEGANWKSDSATDQAIALTLA